MQIKQIEVASFKRFTDLKIVDLPITARLIILAGPNGNGKSSLFDAFNTYHHHKLSGLGIRWYEDYHEKKLEVPVQFRPISSAYKFSFTKPWSQSGGRKLSIFGLPIETMRISCSVDLTQLPFRT